MPFPVGMTRVNRAVVNPLLRRAAGRVGPLSLLHHRGRRTGRDYTVPVFAFVSPGLVTIALTYGSKVDWLANASAAQGCTLVHAGRMLTLGPPRLLDTDTGLARMPGLIRAVLRAARVREFAEFDVEQVRGLE
jgi:deazaflavin-dependent oxidoreductase (nitroreductase family)